MRSLFTIHAGEFLVGDRINRKLGKKYDVWIPTKDTGVDLLVTRKRLQGNAVGLQVKSSRSFKPPKDMIGHVIATSWFALNAEKVRKSEANLWVFVILTLKHEEHFIIIPTEELQNRIPRGCGKNWNLYLWVFDDRSCYQARGLDREERLAILRHPPKDPRRNFSKYLEEWNLLHELTKNV